VSDTNGGQPTGDAARVEIDRLLARFDRGVRHRRIVTTVLAVPAMIGTGWGVGLGANAGWVDAFADGIVGALAGTVVGALVLLRTMQWWT